MFICYSDMSRLEDHGDWLVGLNLNLRTPTYKAYLLHILK